MATTVARRHFQLILLYPIASRFHANQVTGSEQRTKSCEAGSFVGELANAERSEAGKGGLGGNPAKQGKSRGPGG